MTPELDRTRPVWRQVAGAIATRVDNGEYPVGARVPSVVELSTAFGIATSTGQKASAHARAEGLIRAEAGLGPFVADRSREAAAEDEG
jgi:DNA-binding transcriptional regulator YhcF (GntR family)